MPEEYSVEIKLYKTELDGSVSSTVPWRITQRAPDLHPNVMRSHPELEAIGEKMAYQLQGKLKETLQEHNNYLTWMARLMQQVLILRTEPDKSRALESIFLELCKAKVFEQMRLDITLMPDHTTKLMSLVTAAKALLKDPQDDKNYEALLRAAEDL